MTANEAFVMSMGKKAGNLKGRLASPGKPRHATAKPGDPNRKGRGKVHTQGPAMKAQLQAKTGTTHTTQLAKGPYKDRHQSLGKVHGGFKVTG